MAVTQNLYTGNGSTVLYSFTFPYLETTDIKVSVNGTNTTAYTLANATTIQFNTAPVNGAAIRIYRQTDDTALPATFYSGSAIRANDLNENFTQNLYVTQESTNNAASATSTANTALTNSNTAISTANTALSQSTTALSNSSTALSQSNTAISNSATALSQSNTAISDSASAVSTAATASSNASTALSQSNTALSNSSTALSQSTTALSNSTTAVSTASSAVSTANTALSTANAAQSTANTADANANAALNAIAGTVQYVLVANVAAIPGSPANGDAIEIADSTGIESFSPLTNRPAGFVGDSGLSVRLQYLSAGSSWNWLNYFPNNAETRYLKLAGGTLTGQLRADDSTSVASPVIAFDGDTNTGIAHTGADELALVTGGTARVTIDPSGNVAVSGGLTKGGNNVVTVGDSGTVTSTMIADGTIVNSDVNASAAIAGTKISPDFGSQNVTTTGTSTAASFIPSSSTVPTNGLYLPSAGSVAISTNGSQKLLIDSTGRIGASVTMNASYGVFNLGNINGASGNEFHIGYGANGDNYYTAGSSGIHVFRNATSEKLRITSAGLVGIGTSSPSSTLNVVAQSDTAGGDGITLGNSTGNRKWLTRFGTNTNLGLYQDFWDGATWNTRLALTYTGNLGIGSSTAEKILTVLKNGDSGLYIKSADTNHSNLQLGVDTANSYSFIQSGSAGSGSALNMAFFVGSTERARLDTSGRLLVGTSTARSAGGNFGGSTGKHIHVETTDIAVFTGISNKVGGGSAFLVLGASGGATTGSVDIVSNGTGLGAIKFAGADGTDIQSLAGQITCEVDGTPGADDMPGRLVFSVSQDGSASPTERMRINNAGATANFAQESVYHASSAAGAGTTHRLYTGQHSASATFGGTTSFQVWTNGNVQNTNNSYTAISDIKLKENVVDANSQWDDIKALQVRNYNLKEGQTHRQIGLIAQEVEPISPGLVYESLDRDAEGNDLGTVTKSVNYSVLYMKAVKALQEAMERIETLEAKVAALESA